MAPPAPLTLRSTQGPSRASSSPSSSRSPSLDPHKTRPGPTPKQHGAAHAASSTRSTRDPFATIRSTRSIASVASTSTSSVGEARTTSPRSSQQQWRQSRMISSDTLVDPDSSGTSGVANNQRWSIWTAASTTLDCDCEDEVPEHEREGKSSPLEVKRDCSLRDKFGICGEHLIKPTDEDLNSYRGSITSSSLDTPSSTGCTLSTSAASSHSLRGEMTALQHKAMAGYQDQSGQNGDDDSSDEGDAALNAALVSANVALQAANLLLHSTLSDREYLSSLQARQREMDSQLEERERELRAQLERNRSMEDALLKVNREMEGLLASTSIASNRAVLSGGEGGTRWRTLARPEVHVSPSTRLEGIVEAQDVGATIGKTAAKRLERMLAGGASSSNPNATAGGTQDAKALLTSLAASTPKLARASSSASVISSSSSGAEDSLAAPLSTPSLLGVGKTAAASTTTAATSASPARGPMPKHRRSQTYFAPSSVAPSTSASSSLQDVHEQLEAEDRWASDPPPVTPQNAPVDLPPLMAVNPTPPPHRRVQSASAASMLLSTGHARSPSVIKPSTPASSEFSAYNALRSPGLGVHEEDGEIIEDANRARDEGALARLKLLRADSAPGGGKQQGEAAVMKDGLPASGGTQGGWGLGGWLR
ncbi:hypothetical protein BDZ90DRAFT_261280 [Jaminaea rosea]|uniref:Uncharacterized protein n=1 Tax=Jaminaea rosea TaxID=1569628 RepID=A0A316UNX0_9BASI|nr:hypothetical protein BDZ90DRAFT_261280 [Jaminaea rosea]PWN26468.1 hypothetical protein BDZ90DRAFT_261280 [Jaminaea rosea]